MQPNGSMHLFAQIDPSANQGGDPIHPEIFDRLYTDWSTLVKFQRTRGVLRLMAAVIHSLWEKGDKNPLILPANISIDEPRVQFELTRYLSDNWTPIIEKDADGGNEQAGNPRGISGSIRSLRSSESEFETLPITPVAKHNLANDLAALGLLMARRNKDRHSCVCRSSCSQTIPARLPAKFLSI